MPILFELVILLKNHSFYSVEQICNINNEGDKNMQLTRTDIEAIKKNDSDYINNKGANLYMNKEYKDAIEYYRLASAMGNVQAISNLGYCYLYGRDIEADTDTAIAYFELAADRQNVDASYKLGDIYGSDKWGKKDPELSIYYYRLAASWLIDDSWDAKYRIACTDSLQRYPSLCFALAREMMPGGYMRTDIIEAYQFLKHAEKGYRIEIANGANFYTKAYEDVIDMIDDNIFDAIRDEIDSLFE